MFDHSLTVKRSFLNTFLLMIAALMLLQSVGVNAQEPGYNSERKRALDLINESKLLDALPILEKLAARNPEDGEVLFMLGFAIIAKNRETKDPAIRKQERLRARNYLVRARELGQKEPALEQMINAIPPDGGDAAASKFTSDPAADKAMNEGESAYARGELDDAFVQYTQALKLDPKLYEAALFAGDMKFKKGLNSTESAERNSSFDQAGEWFARAIAINPDRETAYRYWGNTLLANDKDDLALPKYIEAIIADPYNQLVYTGLTKWSRKRQVSLGHPRIEIPTSVSSSEKGNVNITLDPKLKNEDGSSAWTLYGLKRAIWINKKFQEKYPQEKEYRHSLDEEFDALSGVASQVKSLVESKKVTQLSPSLADLIRISDAGLLEPYILFAMVDRGIAQDYQHYRQANREKLRRYWQEIVIGAANTRSSQTGKAVRDDLETREVFLSRNRYLPAMGLRGSFSSRIAVW
jgi:tetratricopeptide (TPR) repeat protein